MTEANFIKLVPEVPRFLRLRNPRTQVREIKDPETGERKRVITQVWEAVGEIGLLQEKEFSTTSFKLATRLNELWLKRQGPELRVTLIQHGTGRASEVEIQTPAPAARI